LSVQAELQRDDQGASRGSPHERALIQRIRAGESELFHELIRPYERGVYGVIYSVLHNAADAEEVAQETFFKAYQCLAQLRDDQRFKGWLMRVAVNEARMRRRKDRQHLYEPLEIDSPEDDSAVCKPRSFADWHDLPSENLDREELRQAVRDAVDKLPENYRTIFLLADAQSLDYEEIAATLNLSMPAVKTRIHRARMKLQENLKPAYKPRMRDHLLLMKGMNPWSHARK
jgi:RNA polymerase sigma-70 factor (ECF subfamily)